MLSVLRSGRCFDLILGSSFSGGIVSEAQANEESLGGSLTACITGVLNRSLLNVTGVTETILSAQLSVEGITG